MLILTASLVVYLLLGTRPLSVTEFLEKLLSGTVHISHWYLYAYLGYLIFLPFLRKIASQITTQDIILLTALRIFFTPFMMTLNYWLEYHGLAPLRLSDNLSIPLIGYDCFFCPLVGYYLSFRVETGKMTKKQLWGWIILFFGSNILSSLMTYAEGVHTGFTQTYIGMCRFLSAMSVFSLVKYFFSKFRLPQKLEALVVYTSSVTLGIYLLEPMVIHYLSPIFFSRIPWIPPIITVFSVLWCITCMAVAGCTTFVLRKIPGVRKYL